MGKKWEGLVDYPIHDFTFDYPNMITIQQGC